jgi:hypothetical protein
MSKLPFINDPRFTDPDWVAATQFDLPEQRQLQRLALTRENRPLLTREQEQHLFKQYNYNKWLACTTGKLIEAQTPPRVAAHHRATVKTAQQKAIDIFQLIFYCNVSLVCRFVQKFNLPGCINEFQRLQIQEDMNSEGLCYLGTAINGFDYRKCHPDGLPYKFSTYATYALISACDQVITRQHMKHHRNRMQHESVDYLPWGVTEHAADTYLDWKMVEPEIAKLTKLEKDVLFRRSGYHDKRCWSFRSIGLLHNISRTSAKVVFNTAVDKIKTSVRNQSLSRTSIRQLHTKDTPTGNMVLNGNDQRSTPPLLDAIPG